MPGNPIDHQLNGGKPLFHQQRCGMLPVAQGRSVRRGNNDGPGGIGGRQIKAETDSGGSIQEHPVIGLGGFFNEPAENNVVHQTGAGFAGGREQLKPGDHRMLRRIGEILILHHHVQKANRSAVGHAQGNVQVAQADVAVDGQNPLPHSGKTGGKSGTKGGFSGAAFAGGYH